LDKDVLLFLLLIELHKIITHDLFVSLSCFFLMVLAELLDGNLVTMDWECYLISKTCDCRYRILSSLRCCFFYNYRIFYVFEASSIVYLFIAVIFLYILTSLEGYSSMTGFNESCVAFLILAIVPKVFISFIYAICAVILMINTGNNAFILHILIINKGNDGLGIMLAGFSGLY
jgi:hypothetical protein